MMAEQIPFAASDRATPPQDGHAAQDSFASRHGWRSCATGDVCLRWVAGRRCTQLNPRGVCDGCAQEFLPILDHARRWRTQDRVRVLTAEPYGMAGADRRRELDVLTSVAEGLSLVVEERPDLSVWYPPYTSMLVIRTSVAVLHL
jgi:hypothetical protein